MVSFHPQKHRPPAPATLVSSTVFTFTPARSAVESRRRSELNGLEENELKAENEEEKADWKTSKKHYTYHSNSLQKHQVHTNDNDSSQTKKENDVSLGLHDSPRSTRASSAPRPGWDWEIPDSPSWTPESRPEDPRKRRKSKAGRRKRKKIFLFVFSMFAFCVLNCVWFFCCFWLFGALFWTSFFNVLSVWWFFSFRFVCWRKCQVFHHVSLDLRRKGRPLRPSHPSASRCQSHQSHAGGRLGQWAAAEPMSHVTNMFCSFVRDQTRGPYGVLNRCVSVWWTSCGSPPCHRWRPPCLVVVHEKSSWR